METADGALTELGKAILEQSAGVLDGLKEQTEMIVTKTLGQHKDHLQSHDVTQNDVDPYKVVSWFGCAVLAEVTCEAKNPKDRTCAFRAVARALINTLCGLLAEDSSGKVVFPANTRKLLLKMLIREKLKQGEQGIWQNGLYAAFHSAVVTLREMEKAPRVD